jgi:hypothetical protein
LQGTKFKLSSNSSKIHFVLGAGAGAELKENTWENVNKCGCGLLFKFENASQPSIAFRARGYRYGKEVLQVNIIQMIKGAGIREPVS